VYTRASEGAKWDSEKLLWYIVAQRNRTQIKPHKRFIDNLPLSSVKNCFIGTIYTAKI
jgi:hypothetical protein